MTDRELNGQFTGNHEQPEVTELSPSPQEKSISRKRRLFYLFLFVVGVLALFIIPLLFTGLPNEKSEYLEYMEKVGYGGVLLMGIIGSAAPVWPLPGSWAAALAAIAGLNPFAIAFAAGFGEPIGELAGYSLGYGGAGQLPTHKWKRYSQIQNWMQRRGGITIFFVSAIPNFFIKLATIAAGSLHYPLWKFFIFCWAGKTIKSFGFAYIGVLFSDWVLNRFGISL